MAQMWLLWWPKCSSSVATTKIPIINTTRSTTSTTTTATTTNNNNTTTTATTTSTIVVDKESGKENWCCGCLKRLIKKLKRQGRMLRAGSAATRQSSFQCRYDPLSYALNFDTSGCGSLLDDEDYYHFCAFSSRFVANPRTSSSSTLVLLPTTATKVANMVGG